MTSLATHQASEFVKLIFIGNSGAGKTGALTSLVSAGYNLRIIDLDNGLDALYNHVEHECPERLSSVDFETISDAFKTNKLGQVVIDGRPTAFTRACRLIDRWADGSVPAEWGGDKVLVIDSLTALSKYCFHWTKRNKPDLKQNRHWIGVAQECIMDLLYSLTSAEFRTNVIIISHIDKRDDEAFVSSIGKAIGPKIPHRFNTLIASRVVGQGKNVRRTIHTVPTAMLDLKNPAPFRMGSDPYPIETGLSSIFSVLKGKTNA